MYSIFRFSQKRSNASRLLSTQKRDLFKTKTSGRPDAAGLIQLSQKMLGNNRLLREKRIKPWLSPLLGEKADSTQVLSTRRSQHKIQQSIAPFAAQARVEGDLFLGVGKMVQRDDQQIIRTQHSPVFQTTKLTALLSRGDAWGSQCKQEKNNADISAFYQTYRLYSSLPKQEKKTTDEGKKIKWMRSKWMMLLGGLGVLLLLVFIYKMKKLLVFSETAEKTDAQLIKEAVLLKYQDEKIRLSGLFSEHAWLEYAVRGVIYHMNGDLDNALLNYSAALSINPDLAEIFTNRGLAWYDKGELDKALSDYSTALDINSNLYQAFTNRGLVWRDKGDFDRALSDFNMALSLNPKDDKAFYNRGAVWRDKGELDRALLDFDAALLLNPKDYMTLNNRGIVLQAKGELDKALSDFDAALLLNPKDYMTLNNRGIAWQVKGELDKALADFDAALLLNPKNYESFYNRGVVWYDKGELDKALLDFNLALSLNLHNDKAFYNRGLIWHNKGDLDKALSDYSAAIALNSRDYMAFTNRGIVWREKGELDKALSDYNTALKLNPNLYHTLNNRGNIRHEKGDLDKALSDYNAALAVNSNSYQTFTNRGDIWRDRNAWDKALNDYDKALAIKQDVEQALFGRGMAWHAKGELQKAQKNYKATLKVNPEHLGALFNRATVWARLGGLNEAAEDFDHVLSLDFHSDYPTANQQLTLVREKIKAFNEGKKQPDPEPQDNDGQQTGLSIGPYDPKPNPLRAENFKTLREKQIELFKNQQREHNTLVTKVEEGNKSFVLQAIEKGDDLEQSKVIEHGRWLTYQTPIREARAQWACSSKEEDEDRYDILKALVQHRCVSHRCFGGHDMKQFIEQGLQKCEAEKFKRSQKIVNKLFAQSLDKEHEAAINLVLNEKLGTTWSDVYLRGQKNRAILIAHLNELSVSPKQWLGYGNSLGWKIRDSLLLRLKACYLLMIAHQQIMADQQMIAKDATEAESDDVRAAEKEVGLLKQEMVILQNLFRDTDVTLTLGKIPEKKERKPLLNQHAKSIVHHIQQTKNTEYTVWGGYPGHTLFVDVIKQDKKYYLKVDNLGNGVKRHKSDEKSGEKLYYPCLLNAVGLDELALEMYIGQLLETRVTPIEGAKKKKAALDKIYRGVRTCVDHRSEDAGLTQEVKKHTATWESERKQQTTDCVLRSYAVSSKSRLNRSLKSPVFFKEYEDGYLKMRDFLDRYGLS
jgi:tetratricopeptide (TPR) repeat protein